jgi:ketosteroid isomerase-like protein
MSQENVQIVRAGLDRYNETGEPPWETFDPEIEWVIDPAAFVGGSYRGHDGIREMVGRLAEGFDYVRFDFDRYLDAGDTVVALGRLSVRGGSSGVSVGQPIGYLFRVRDGRITYARAYLQPEDALRAAGLQE